MIPFGPYARHVPDDRCHDDHCYDDKKPACILENSKGRSPVTVRRNVKNSFDERNRLRQLHRFDDHVFRDLVDDDHDSATM